ncbi:hypothetical protein CYMTET_46230 [Cymbomonas tetramitiformis]|uniref:Trichohyalin-plectin-homology domain-containing protein n=1 Tax=Cymbomonas tetramitiformis TaxID=36881 RepID=A0AAE0EXI3_9CHLO|nr:hypothetical protein CYMTET_46230 [Cymbomonas tetramitiformis]
MPPKTHAHQAASRLKVALQTKLGQVKGDETLVQSLYQALRLVETFLNKAEGTEGELEALKSQVTRCIANKGSSRKAASARTSFRPAKAATPPRSAEKVKAVSKTQDIMFAAQKPEIDFTLPLIAIERKGRTHMNEYGKMAILADQRYENERLQKKNNQRAQQMMNKAELEFQMQENQLRRLEEIKAKDVERKEMTIKVETWEKEAEEQFNVHLQKVAKSKVERKQQVDAKLAQVKAEHEYDRAEDQRILQAAIVETVELEKVKAAIAERNRNELKATHHENLSKVQEKMRLKEQEKEHDILIWKQGEQLALQREQQRVAAREKITARAAKMAIMSDSDNVKAREAEKRRKIDERIEREQANFNRLEDEKVAIKQAKKKQMKVEMLTSLDVQLKEKEKVVHKELQEKHELAQTLEENFRDYEQKEADLKALKKHRNYKHGSEVYTQIIDDAQKRYVESQDHMPDVEKKLQRTFLEALPT